MATPIQVVLTSPQQLVKAQPSRMAALLSPLLSTPVNAARVINNPSSSLSSVSNSSSVESSSFLRGETGSFFGSTAFTRSSLAVTSSVRRGSFSFASASFSCSVSVSGSSSSPACFGGTGLLAFSSPAPAPGLGRRASMTTNASSATAPSTAKSVHDFTVKDINGQEVDLSVYKGKVLLIVNVASACGLTSSNYTELAEVYAGLKESGLEILAFPCNQFGGQEPGSNEQIKAFCSRFKAEYPIFDKVDVNGPNTAPVYQFLKASKGGGILGDSIKWNFAKFLVNQDGIVVERYAPTTSPKKIEGDIRKLLAV